jgi:hypothetical protein
MGPEQTKLMDRLFGDPSRKLVNFKFTRGDKPATAEEICEQMNKAFEDLERRRASGELGDGLPVRSNKPPTDVREFVANL